MLLAWGRSDFRTTPANHHRLPPGHWLGLEDVRDVDIRRVVGMEVYPSNLEAPPQYPNSMDSEHRCGTIVVWRRN
jgi:hypothetical protein